MHTKFWLAYLKGRGNLEDLYVNEEDNIRKDLMEVGLEGVDWIPLTQERTSGGSYENDNELSGRIKGGEFLD